MLGDLLLIFLVETCWNIPLLYQTDMADFPAHKTPGASLSEDDFEFVETPAAPSPAPEAQDYGVRTTSVRSDQFQSFFTELFC